MRRTSVWVPRALCAAIVFAAPGMATAQVGGVVLNGSTLSYAGANQLRIGTGSQYSPGAFGYLYTATTAFTFSTIAPPAGQVWWGTSSSSCPNPGTSVQAPNTAYYVYVNQNDAVISAIPPSEDGLASAPMFVNDGDGYGCRNLQDFGPFVGSFITDLSGGHGNVVPFHRMGENVLLVYNANTTPSAYPLSPAFDLAGPSATTQIETVTLGFTYPASASSLILDVFVEQFTPDTVAHSVDIYDPNFGLPPTAGNCETGNWGSGLFQTFLVYPALANHQWVRVIYPTAPTITMADCGTHWPAGGGSDAAQVFFEGYVEPVHHLNF